MRIITFSADERRALAHDRYHHPDPRVQRKMEVIWLKSHGLNHDDIAAYADVSRRTVQRYLDGATVAFSGSAPDGPGWWLPPTVVESTDTSEPVWREEVFGPVVAVMAFDDEEEAVALANDSDYGLSGSIFTADLGRALRVSRGVEAGNLSVNSHSSVRYWTPFGGYKQSGLGRELGPDAPHAFTEEKNVFIAH
jgi:betaine-aldehyde dehydrogenase